VTQTELETPAVGEVITAESIEQTSRSRGEPEWLTQQRLAAWSLARALPQPTKSTEGWRRIDLGGLDVDTLVNQRPTARGAAAHSELAESLSGVAGHLRIENGAVLERTLSADLERKGVILTSLRQALAERPALVERHLGRLVTGDESTFVALAAALWEDGLFLHVPAGVTIEQPILHRVTSSTGAPSFFRSLVIVDQATQVTVVEDYVSDESAGESIASGTVEIVTGQGAQVRYANLQEWNTKTWHFNRLKSETGRDSRLDWLFVAVGGQIHRAEVDAELTSQGAETDLVGLIFGSGDQQFDHQVLQDHVGNDTRSNSNFKAALGDASSSNFQGLIRVNKTSLRTDSNLENRNLLLSDHSKAESDPRLEILNSDVVRCAHGATVGPLDPEIIFYLQSRGIPPDEAKRIVVEAFFDEVLAKIPVPAIRNSVWRTVQRKLGRKVGANEVPGGADAWQNG
jgi:Fe-S cluster assembly protein SufD